MGLAAPFRERRNASWITVAETGNSVRNPPRAGRIEIDACGRCHGRATRLIGDTVHGRPLLDSHRPALITDTAQPAIVRASALRQLAPWLTPGNTGPVLPSLGDADPLMRLAAVETLAHLPPPQRSAMLAGHLHDPVRAVRMEAASALAGEPERALPASQRPAFEQALAEYIASLQFNLDRPDTAVSLGDLQLRRGATAAAEQSYRHALGLDPAFTPAHLHLADLARTHGQELDADRILRTALEYRPDAAELHHALGLSLVRQRRAQEALTELQQAAELAPEQARYSYVLAVALNDSGQAGPAREWLGRALELHPYDTDLLRALAIYELEAGNHQTARALTQRLLALDRNHPDAHQLLQWIERHR